MTRASLFRETKGVAVEMVNRVFDLPAFSGKPISFMSGFFVCDGVYCGQFVWY